MQFVAAVASFRRVVPVCMCDAAVPRPFLSSCGRNNKNNNNRGKKKKIITKYNVMIIVVTGAQGAGVYVQLLS